MKKFLIAGVLVLFATNAFAQFVNQMPEYRQPEAKVEQNRELRANIVALVNGEPISLQDIQDRLKIFEISAQIPINEQTREFVYQKTLHGAIDEKIMQQEALKNKIEVSEEDIKAAMARIEQVRNMEKGALKQEAVDSGADFEVFKEQIKTELLWGRLVRMMQGFENKISETEVQEAAAKSEESFNRSRALVSEIFISDKNAKNIDDLVQNIKQDNRFNLYAIQFSESPSVANGGSLGWVEDGMLESALDKVLKNMSEGEVSEPIKTARGFYILKLEKKYNPQTEGKPKIDKKEIRAFLENEKTEKFAQNFLQKLRQKAVIEVRN